MGEFDKDRAEFWRGEAARWEWVAGKLEGSRDSWRDLCRRNAEERRRLHRERDEARAIADATWRVVLARTEERNEARAEAEEWKQRTVNLRVAVVHCQTAHDDARRPL